MFGLAVAVSLAVSRILYNMMYCVYGVVYWFLPTRILVDDDDDARRKCVYACVFCIYMYGV